MQPSRRTAPSSALHGFTVLELMLAVSIMMVIVIGLYTVFDQTQRALRGTIAQVDVQEGIRATSDLMVRDFESATPVVLANTNRTSFAATANRYSVQVALNGLPKGTTQNTDPVLQTLIQDVLLTTRQNDFWKTVGYWVGPRDTNEINKPFMVGRLYRYSVEYPSATFAGTDLYRRVWDNSNHALRYADSQPVLDGVVHMRVLATATSGYPLVYGDRGRELVNDLTFRQSEAWMSPRSWFVDPLRDDATAYRFSRGTHPQFPATLELEIAMVEPATLTRFHAIPVAAEARKFLARNTGKIHVFRHLISLRNSPPS